jgi:hypothetical protein
MWRFSVGIGSRVPFSRCPATSPVSSDSGKIAAMQRTDFQGTFRKAIAYWRDQNLERDIERSLKIGEFYSE